MNCPKCRSTNREGITFCEQCGAKMELECPKCKAQISLDKKFCGECGHNLAEQAPPEGELSSKKRGERKHVTILFSDLTGYTALSEELDPEEVKEIMSRIFGEIALVIDRYEGFVEKYAGDAVMAVFGVPNSHEDDPIRAVKAAIEIRDLVLGMSPQFEGKVGQPLSVHSGINTGLVVTGQVNLEKGTHGLMGDAINTAARILGLAKTGEILVGYETYRQSEGYFDFEERDATKVKGKSEPVTVYRMVSGKERPVTVRRLSGLKADLIGRKSEMDQLAEAVQRLREGKGAIFSICGNAGTGKSRLVEDFKATLDLEEIQLLECHAFAYAQNIPYFPLIDLINKAFHIEEGDPAEKMREKVESQVGELVAKKAEVVPYVGSLYSLNYPELGEMSPELWKHHLQEAVKTILSALARKAPTIFFLEDLHWADASFLELLRQALSEIRHPALVICAYRPPFTLFTTHQLSALPAGYHEISLNDLSSSEAQEMVGSLLKTDSLPRQLSRFVQDKAEGNPFYLEEVVNSLIESEGLVQDNGKWRLTGQISDLNISSTVHGVISARLDRLEKEAKRILQEASVIGRVFLYDILKRVTEIKDQVDRYLDELEKLDLIRARSIEPDLEYVFKHTLVQEAVYSGLLKRERQEIHERIGLVMEQLFHDRLPEFYETLAFHFKQGRSIQKAVDYLMKAAQKSLRKYALEESDQHFREAFQLLSSKQNKTKEEDASLIRLLNEWSVVFHFQQMYTGLFDLLNEHKAMAASLTDRETLGMYYTWLGFALEGTEHLEDSYDYLCKALEIGEEIQSQKVIGYACARLARTCVDFNLEKAIAFGVRAKEMAETFKSDHVLFLSSLWALGYTYFFRGESKKTGEIGRSLLDYGEAYSDNRCTTLGHLYEGIGHFIGGDFSSAIECYQRAIEVSVDPIFYNLSNQMLGFCLAADNQSDKARMNPEAVLEYSKTVGTSFIGSQAQASMIPALLAKGNLGEGMRLARVTKRTYLKKGSKYRVANIDFFSGKVYLQMVERSRPMNISFLLKNIGFLLKNLPLAGKKAETHFSQAIEIANEIGAKGIVGQSYLGLGNLHRIKGKTEKARENFSKAMEIFKETEADVFLRQTEDALESLKTG